MQEHSEWKGEKLAKEVDKQHWDPSIKAMTQFPSVLANMDKNLSWTSALGDAYINQQKGRLQRRSGDAPSRRVGRKSEEQR